MAIKAERKKNGLCEQCGAVLDRVGICCKACNGKNNMSKYLYFTALHLAGKCPQCRKQLDRDGLFCSSCLKKSNAKAKERTAQRRANHQCIQCGQKTDLGSYCRRCLDMIKERRARKKESQND